MNCAIVTACKECGIMISCILSKSFCSLRILNTQLSVLACCQRDECIDGGDEFAGQENDGQRNFRGWKLQDWKMTDKSAGLENARLENDGQICRGWKMQDWKLTDKSAASKM